MQGDTDFVDADTTVTIEVEVEDPETMDVEDPTEDAGEDEMTEEVDAEIALMFASLPEPVFTVEDDDLNTSTLEAGSFPKRYVRRILFENMTLATEERNKNGDVITAANLGELASTIADMPIADKHPRRNAKPTVFGVFTGGKVATVQVEGKEPRKHLLASGYLWSGRHPTLVRQTIMGERRASIEAHSQEEGCSVCGQWFSSSDDYCSHLSFITAGMGLPDNVSRLHRGLISAGSAIVPNPAGSDVGFHDPRFFLSADMNYEETDMPDETPIVEAETVVDAVTPTADANSEIVSRLEAAKSDLETLVTASENKLTLFKTRVIAMLEAGVAHDEIKKLIEDDNTLDMTDAAFALVCENLKPRSVITNINPTVLADDDTDTASFSKADIYGG